MIATAPVSMTAMEEGRDRQEVMGPSPLPGPEHRIEIGLVPWETRSLTDLSTLWFHRPFPSDDWLLLRHHGTVSAHGRAYGRGDALTMDGTLVPRSHRSSAALPVLIEPAGDAHRGRRTMEPSTLPSPAGPDAAGRYRMAQWVTGTIGRRALRAIAEHPDLELTALYSHSPDKHGLDAAELHRVRW